MVLVNELIERLNKLDGTREIRLLDVANGDCDDETSGIRGVSRDSKGRYYFW